MTKKLIVLFLAACLLAVGCSKTPAEPESKLTFIVSGLTDEEYDEVGTSELKNPTKDDFMKIDFDLTVKKSDKISNREITIPSFKEVINSTGEDRYWFANSTTNDTPTGDAEYTADIVFYAKGLNDQDIRNMFSSSEVVISWSENGSSREKVYNLGESIEFK